MTIGVDSSKWKPRKLAGTPALKTFYYLASGILGFGIITGIFLQYGDLTKIARQGFERLYEDPIEEVERKLLIASSLPVRTGDQLRKLAEEAERVDLPDK